MVSFIYLLTQCTPDMRQWIIEADIASLDGKKPDWTSMMPWKNGESLIWDATYLDTFSPSDMALEAREPDLVNIQAENTNIQKCSLINSTRHIIPETMKICSDHRPCPSSRIWNIGSVPRLWSHQFLLQSFAIAIQRCSGMGHLTCHRLHLSYYGCISYYF